MRLVTMAAIAATGLGAAGAAAQEDFVIPDTVAATATQLADTGLESDLAWNILESLTTEIGPRLGGSEAEARA
ncbi:MAG TPA: peptidase M28 family protein, partial [Alphaproteobacteria bacterium]|nr:peptidase M28 family protein [Alphaproteobacteria bacterium]